MKKLAPEFIFKSDQLSQELAKKSVWGGITTISAQGIQFSLSLVGTMILARLLTPNDFGLIGMVAAIMGFAEMFKNAGLTMATVNKDHITHEQISTLFWLNIIISIALGFCLLAISPLVAIFYQRSELTAVTAALSISFIISGFGIQHQALLYRHMMFGSLAIIQILSSFINLSTSIILACLGWHYWALVGGLIAATFTNIIITCSICPWRPGWITRGSGARKMFEFGGRMTVANVSYYLSMNLDNVLVGKYLGDTALGFYTKAYSLFLMPVTQIKSPLLNVSMPVLCSLRYNPERYAKFYLRIVDILASLVIPGALYCVIEGDFLIQLFLGKQWMGAVAVFRILAIAGLIYPLNGMQTIVPLSMGYSSLFMKWGLFNTTFCVIGFVAGLPFGIEGVAVGFATASYLVGFISLFCCFYKAPVTNVQFVWVLVPPFLISFLSLGGVILVKYAWNRYSIANHLTCMAVFFVIYVLVSCCRKTVRETIGIFYKELSIFLEKKRGSNCLKVI